MESNGPMLDAALAYVRRGWEVFPLYTANPGGCSCRRRLRCPHPGKHPLTRHGLHDATTDEDTIRRWCTSWPTANVAVATGFLSDLVVIDVDPANGGEASLERLESLMGSLAPTLSVRTGDGGYVVAPPSRHTSGGQYVWVEESAPPAPAPAWLRPDDRGPSSSAAVPTPLPYPTASRYGLTALRAEADAVRHAPMGSRNNRLNRSAFCLGTLVAGGELDDTLVEATLLAAAVDAGLSEAEARASLASGLNAGARSPRTRAQ